MTLGIQINDHTDQSIKHLKKVCPDPQLSFEAANGGIRNSTSEVRYPMQTVDTVGCSIVFHIVKSPNRAVIHGVPRGFNFEGKPMREWIAVTGQKVPVAAADAGTPIGGVPPRAADIYYDATNNLGSGYYVYGAEDKKIAAPMHVNLFHELVHAREVTSAQASLDPNQFWEDREAVALLQENKYRAQCSPPLPRRHGYEGGAYDDGCFIASAAYGSPIAPEVELLRRFRDDVLRKTRVGNSFFDEYWERYYELSPTVVSMMNDNPEVREMVRWSLVTPIVEYLRIALEMPDAPLDDVPQPWRSFLDDLGGSLESWAANIDQPTALGELPPAAAAEELGIALRYLHRRPQSRFTFLHRLAAEAQLPLACESSDRAEVEAILRRHGRSQGEIELVLGPPAKPSRRTDHTPIPASEGAKP